MSRLAKRIRTATESTDPSLHEATDARVLPYSCCSEFIAAHPFVTMFHISPMDIHDAVIHLDTFLVRMLSTRTINEDVDVRRCFECKLGSIVVDDRNGYEVCAECGLVQTRGNINIVPEFVHGVDESDLPRKRTWGVRGVPQWMVQKTFTERDANVPRTYMDELEQMNAYMHLTLDDLSLCERWLQQWSGGHYAPLVRVSAAMMYTVLRDKFIRESDVRLCHRKLKQYAGTKIQNGRMVPTWSLGWNKLPVVKDVVPTATFECPTCGAMEHTRKGARYHCRRVIRCERK